MRREAAALVLLLLEEGAAGEEEGLGHGRAKQERPCYPLHHPAFFPLCLF